MALKVLGLFTSGHESSLLCPAHCLQTDQVLD